MPEVNQDETTLKFMREFLATKLELARTDRGVWKLKPEEYISDLKKQLENNTHISGVGEEVVGTGGTGRQITVAEVIKSTGSFFRVIDQNKIVNEGGTEVPRDIRLSEVRRPIGEMYEAGSTDIDPRSISTDSETGRKRAFRVKEWRDDIVEHDATTHAKEGLGIMQLMLESLNLVSAAYKKAATELGEGQEKSGVIII